MTLVSFRLACLLLLVVAFGAHLRPGTACDIPGSREFGAFADVLRCTRQATHCRVVYLTVILQRVDKLRPIWPPGDLPRSPLMRAIMPKVCYYAFVDQPTYDEILNGPHYNISHDTQSTPSPYISLLQARRERRKYRMKRPRSEDDYPLFPPLDPEQEDQYQYQHHQQPQEHQQQPSGCGVERYGWNVLMVPEEQLFYRDPRRDSRIFKTLMHLFFPHAIYHVYMDGTVDLQMHPLDIVQQHLVQRGTFTSPQFLLSFPQHNRRKTAEQEVAEVERVNYDVQRTLYHQLELYHMTNSAPMSPLLLGRFRVQANTPLVWAFECLWFQHISMHSRRDQISLVKVLNDLELLPRTFIYGKPSEYFKVNKHEHSAGRQLNASEPSSLNMPSTESLGVSKQQRYIYVDHNRAGQLASLYYLFNLRHLHSGGEAWEVYLLSSASEESPAAKAEYATEIAKRVPDVARIKFETLPTAGFQLERIASLQDMVIMRFYVDNSVAGEAAAAQLRQFIADGTLVLIDVLIVEYSTYDPNALASVPAVSFKTALHEAVKQGLLIMQYWNSTLLVGWEEKIWLQALRRNHHLQRFLISPAASLPAPASPPAHPPPAVIYEPAYSPPEVIYEPVTSCPTSFYTFSLILGLLGLAFLLRRFRFV